MSVGPPFTHDRAPSASVSTGAVRPFCCKEVLYVESIPLRPLASVGCYIAIVIGTPAIPSPVLEAIARSVEDTAAAFTDMPGFAGEDLSLQRLVDSLAMWSVTIGRMASSGPESELSSARRFRDHPEHDRRDDDPLARLRGHVDVIAYLPPATWFLTTWRRYYLSEANGGSRISRGAAT